MGTKLGDIVDATAISLTDLSGKKLAIDAFNTIYAFLSSIRQPDGTPLSDGARGFELPDSDAKIFSAGLRYQYSEDISMGIAFLYDIKEDRTLAPGVAENDIIKAGGTFDEGGAFLTTLGISYEF